MQETEADGDVSLDRDYDAWGILLQSASTSGYAFTGREWDAEIGLYYYRARYYAPQSGIFISQDPIGLAGGINLVAYVAGDPMNRVDPTGLDWYYEQSTGRIWHANNTTGWIELVGQGYSGHGEGVNKPGYEFVKELAGEKSPGPLPRGTYTIQNQKLNVTGRGTSLPASMRLTPHPNNTMYGRDGFLIHGDNAQNNQTASTGCPVLVRNIRDRIASSGDRTLRVIR